MMRFCDVDIFCGSCGKLKVEGVNCFERIAGVNEGSDLCLLFEPGELVFDIVRI